MQARSTLHVMRVCKTESESLLPLSPANNTRCNSSVVFRAGAPPALSDQSLVRVCAHSVGTSHFFALAATESALDHGSQRIARFGPALHLADILGEGDMQLQEAWVEHYA